MFIQKSFTTPNKHWASYTISAIFFIATISINYFQLINSKSLLSILTYTFILVSFFSYFCFYEKASLKENEIILQKYFFLLPQTKTIFSINEIRSFTAATEIHSGGNGMKYKKYVLKIDSKIHNQVPLKKFRSFNKMVSFTEKLSNKYSLRWNKSEW